MNSNLKTFISQYVALSEEELDEVTAKFKSKRIEKGNYVLKQGEVCRNLIFVQSGCLRMYHIEDGIEISVWFAFQHSSAVEIYSFISEKPSDYFIQATEESEILYLAKDELNKLYRSQPKMQEMMRNFWEDVILHLLERFTALQKDSAEKRYLDLLDKPRYLEKIPQKFLASFIGVTPTSLSRIRRQISQND